MNKENIMNDIRCECGGKFIFDNVYRTYLCDICTTSNGIYYEKENLLEGLENVTSMSDWCEKKLWEYANGKGIGSQDRIRRYQMYLLRDEAMRKNDNN